MFIKRSLHLSGEKQPSQNVRTRPHNIIIKVSILKVRTQNLEEIPSSLEIWDLLFIQNMLDEILKLSLMREKYKRKNYLLSKKCI